MNMKSPQWFLTGITVVLSILFMVCFAVYAAIPQKINYQGYLTDPEGIPVNGTLQMTFSIYDTPTGVTSLWTEAQYVEVNDGVYNVELGAVTPLSIPFDMQYYLGVKIETDPEMKPRQALTSVGYSKSADVADYAYDIADGAVTDAKITGPISGSKIDLTGIDADTVDGKHADEFSNAAHDHDAAYVNEGQAVSVSSFMIADGAVTDAKITGPISGSKIDLTGIDADTLDGKHASDFGDGHSLDADDGDPADSLYVDNAGNIGIGTKIPSEKLTVDGVIESTGGGIKFPDGTIQATASAVYVKTVVVNPVPGDAVAGGEALLAALAEITDASPANPYLLKIEPGLYDISLISLQMKAFVDIEGSGENVTKIRGNIDSESSGVIRGVNNAEIRSLTVERSGGGAYARALYNDNASPKITNVTANVSGGTNNRAVYNSNSSSPLMTNVTAKAGGGNSYGVYNLSSSPYMINVTAMASGVNSYGVYNHTSSPSMINVSAAASGLSSNHAVYNYNSSSPTMMSVTAIASGGAVNYAVYNVSSSTVRIDHSVLTGATNTVFSDTGTTAFIGNTRLNGPVGGAGAVKCAGVYDANYTFYAGTCP